MQVKVEHARNKISTTKSTFDDITHLRAAECENVGFSALGKIMNTLVAGLPPSAAEAGSFPPEYGLIPCAGFVTWNCHRDAGIEAVRNWLLVIRKPAFEDSKKTCHEGVRLV